LGAVGKIVDPRTPIDMRKIGSFLAILGMGWLLIRDNEIGRLEANVGLLRMLLKWTLLAIGLFAVYVCYRFKPQADKALDALSIRRGRFKAWLVWITICGLTVTVVWLACTRK